MSDSGSFRSEYLCAGFPTGYALTAEPLLDEMSGTAILPEGSDARYRRFKFEVPDQGATSALETARTLMAISEELSPTKNALPRGQRHELTQLHLMLDLLGVKLRAAAPRKAIQEQALAAGRAVPEEKRIHTSTMAAQGLMEIVNSCVNLFDFSRVDPHQPQSASFWAGVKAVDALLQHLDTRYGIRRMPVASGDTFDPETMEAIDAPLITTIVGPQRVARLLNMGFVDADGNVYRRARVQLSPRSDLLKCVVRKALGQ